MRDCGARHQWGSVGVMQQYAEAILRQSVRLRREIPDYTYVVGARRKPNSLSDLSAILWLCSIGNSSMETNPRKSMLAPWGGFVRRIACAAERIWSSRSFWSREIAPPVVARKFIGERNDNIADFLTFPC